jgi:bifunctional non-homologous end joining protein LigD
MVSTRTSRVVQVGRRTVELSNLGKVLFSADGVIKAELVEYYLKVAPTLLRHIKGRPLSFVRYPDGVEGESFFQKNRPEWAPEWIEHVSLGDEEKIDYILANEDATLAWLANLACIEFHQMHCRSPHYDKPDYMVFDLDPPDGYGFGALVEIAVQLRERLEDLGYNAFVKTTGRKGLHVLAPIEPLWDFGRVFEAAGAVARPFVAAHPHTTLHLRKEARQGRVLVDIYRNRTAQTIVAPYSLRAVPGAPVSMPLPWEQLESITDPALFNIHTVPSQLAREGDAWEAMGAYATALHTERRPAGRRSGAPPPNSETSLETYAEKRHFEKTPEPAPATVAGVGDRFVLHRHHAHRLHYDLRLERDGTLKSWAVPKGLPPRPGLKRLAVAVEDHPVGYLEFEGRIPRGEYGAGEMWVFARGRYEVAKEHRDGFDLRLRSRELNGEYRLIHTRDNEWLLDRVDRPQLDWLREPVEPMLAESRDRPPDSSEHLFEVKWDGIRALIAVDEGTVTIRSRSRRDITRQFPELAMPEAFRAACGLFDAEIVCLDPAGKPLFEEVVGRLLQTGETRIAHGRARHPAVCYVFDCLYLDGRPVVGEPLTRRRAWMADAIRPGTGYRISEAFTDGAALYQAAVGMGLEGIMAKEVNSLYMPGKRSSQWLKIKARQTTECVVLGYTRGKGGRGSAFGALHLGQYQGGKLKYLGKVGTGFDARTAEIVFRELQKLPGVKQPMEAEAGDASTLWVEPRLVVEVQYASLTPDRRLREPVFIRLRPDLTA